MEFVTNVNINDYEKFLEKFDKKSHFLQSPLWGNVKKEQGLIPIYVGVKQKGELIAVSLLLKKKLPLNYNYCYSPRGLVLDYENKELLEFFTSNLKIYLKSINSIFLKIDPDISIENKEVITSLKSLGYKHLGFNLNFERSQPRYTFRIDFDKSYEEIFKYFDRSIKKSINKSSRYSFKCYEADINSIDKFNYVMKMTEKRKTFYCHESEYYKKFLEIFKNNASLFIAEINIKKSMEIIKKLIAEETINLNNITGTGKKSKNKKEEINVQISDLKNDMEKLEKLSEKYPNEIVVSSYIIAYYGNKAWALYGGNLGDFMFTNINYSLYNYQLKISKEREVKIYDLFGCTSPNSSEKNLLGLYEFKKKFGGELIEFIGEFDLVVNSFMYFIFTKLIPIYRKIIKRKLRKEVSK